MAQEDSLVKGDMYYANYDYNVLIDDIVGELEESGISPVEEIGNDKYHQSFFKVYHFYLH